MDKCRTCGGGLVSFADNLSFCQYCGNVYNGRGFIISKKMAKNSAADTGVMIFDENIDGILEIWWTHDGMRCSGSGFLISRKGFAITNTHVVTEESGKSCQKVNVRINGKTTTASVIKLGDNRHGSGPGVDLALIELDTIPDGVKALGFENYTNVRTGEKIYVIGNSLGYGTCITSGVVSDRCRNVNGKMLLMTDCAINGGNSGGPVFNDKGKVIGAVVSGIDNAEGMNFAIPSDTITAFIDKCFQE